MTVDRKEINYCNFVWDFVDWYRKKKLFIDPYISGKMASITFVRDPIPISPFPIPQTTLGQHNLQIFVQKLV